MNRLRSGGCALLLLVLLGAPLAQDHAALPLSDAPLRAAAATADDDATTCAVEVVAEVPPDTGTVYLTGNLPALGHWNPGLYAMEGGGPAPRRARLVVPRDHQLELKFTLGSWEREAATADDRVPQNTTVVIRDDRRLTVTIPAWRGADDSPATGPASIAGDPVLGTLVDLGPIASAHLDHARPVIVWLPPGYADAEQAGADGARRYPVLYMHDGQNLFEPSKSFTGIDWGVDEAVVGLVEAGKIPPIIVVGVFNTVARSREYDPFREGDAYARFLVEELKPRIDADYRTRPEAAATGTMGSSLGGLISLGLGWRHPEAFTRLGCVSAHLPPLDTERGGTGRSILDEIEASGLDRSLRIYLDQSTGGPDREYDAYRERFAAMLAGWGWTDGRDYLMRRYENTEHTERDWRARLPIALEFLFGDLASESR